MKQREISECWILTKERMHVLVYGKERTCVLDRLNNVIKFKENKGENIFVGQMERRGECMTVN